MAKNTNKRKDGFAGQRAIIIPKKVLEQAV